MAENWEILSDFDLSSLVSKPAIKELKLNNARLSIWPSKQTIGNRWSLMACRYFMVSSADVLVVSVSPSVGSLKALFKKKIVFNLGCMNGERRGTRRVGE